MLLPLLGITYLVVMAGPNEGVGSYIFGVVRALLLSTQVNCKYVFHYMVYIYFFVYTLLLLYRNSYILYLFVLYIDI